MEDGKCDISNGNSETFESKLRDDLVCYIEYQLEDDETLTEPLFVSCIALHDQQYSLRVRCLKRRLTRRKLADIFADIDVLDETYRPLSELLLQRKVTEQD